MKGFFRRLRIVSSITLFFFSWTYMPIYAAVAYAAQSQVRNTDPAGRVGVKDGNMVASVQKPEERFEKALEDIRKNAGRAEEKTAKNQDASTEIAAIKTERADIEAIDAELRKEFSATEKKLKDAHLPKEILDRHYRFVKHYNDNISRLKAEIADVEKAEGKGDKAAARKALAAVKEHIEKTRPPRKTTPLDPNNLPFRARKVGKARKPRLNKKDFEKDFPKKQTKLATDEHEWARIKEYGRKNAQEAQEFGRELTPPIMSFEGRLIGANGANPQEGDWISVASRFLTSSRLTSHTSPVLVAANGPLTGLLSSDSKPEIHDLPFPVNSESPGVNDFAFSDLTQNSEFNTQNYQLAQATDPPTADDLAETPDIQFTDAIKAKAQELGYNPVKIYEWVRNSREFAPTYGSIQGADMCLQTMQCNDMDTASLLIALLRASNIPARYVYGTVEVSSDKVMNWVGGFSDPQAALTFVASGGVPVAAGMSGGVITKARLEHVWVEANVAYGPYSGRPSNLNPEKIWVPLDPSYKQYTYTDGLDLQSAVPFDAQTFANQVQSSATINQTDGSVTNVDSNYIQTTMTNYQAQVQNYISQNMPNATVGDIIGKKEIKKQEFGILPVTLPYKVITIGAQYSEIPDNLRHKISLTLFDETGSNAIISVTKSLPEIAGKKLTLSYRPASSADETTLISYATSTASSIPVYLINLTPELRIDGQLIAAGSSVGIGRTLPLKITLHSPAAGDTLISKNDITGTYTAVVLDLGVITSSQLDKISAQVAATKTKLDANDLADITKDDIMGAFLYGIGTSYWGTVDTTNKLSQHANSVADVRLPSEGTFTYDLTPTYLFGVPISAIPSGFMTDINSDNHVVVAHDGDTSKEINYMTQIGMFGSRMEASVYDLAFNKAYTGRGITTAHIFEYANQQGISIYSIDSSNINTVRPNLAMPDDVLEDIQNAVNAGKTVMVPKTVVTKNGWTGAGYLILDRKTGSGAYRISGNLSGGAYTCSCFGFTPTQEFLITAILAIAAFTPLEPLVAVVSVILAALSYSSTICQIYHSHVLWDDMQYMIAIATTFYIIAAMSAFFLPFSLAFIGIYMFVVNWLVNEIMQEYGVAFSNWLNSGWWH